MNKRLGQGLVGLHRGEGCRREGRVLSTGSQRKREAGLGSGLGRLSESRATCWQVAEERH